MFEFFIRRPVFSTVLSLLILLIGLVSYGSLTIREYPNIDQPVVNVRTSYPGASAEIIESQVTQVLEASIAGISGIEVISSSSRPEESQIQVRFRLGTDADTAASDVRDRVGRVRKQLPAETEEPVIAKVEADAQAVVNVALLSDRHTALELSDYAVAIYQEPAAEPARRLGSSHLRRAPLCDAHLDRPPAAGFAKPHRAGRRDGAAPAECRSALGPHRRA